MITSAPSLLVSCATAAQMLDVTPWAVHQLCTEGRLPHGRIGTRIVIPRAEVVRLARAVVGARL
jgi:hypothetical protein